VLAGLRQRKVDAILVATDPIFILPVAYLLSLLKRAPLMLDERDVYPDTAVALGVLNSPAIIRVLDWGHKFMCWKAPSIVAATPGIKRILLNKNVNAAKIFVLPNARSCAPLAEAGEIREEIRLRHGWGSRFVALYAGNFGQANDILTILKSAELLRDSSGIHFVFIGAGEKKTQYLEFCRAQKLNNVEFLDAMPWMELQGYLAAADLAVHAFPDIAFWDCALPSKLFDYMWAAKPILFSGRGDTADLIAASGAGEVTRPGDPMAFSCRVSRLSESPEATREMGAKGYRYMAEHFSAEQLVEIMRVAIAALQLGRA
jgi:glycosyltransferase involved in cell wall biosynthesis